jgi:O-antigen ligase
MTSVTGHPIFRAVGDSSPTVEEARVEPLTRAALLLFVVSIPVEFPDRAIPVEITTLTAFLLVGAAALNPSACLRRIPPPVVAFAIYLWAFVAVALVVGVTHRQLAGRLFVNLALMVALVLVASNLLRRPAILRLALVAFVSACAARAAIQLLGVATTSTEVWTGGERVTTLGQNANLSAIILSAGLVAAVGLTRSDLAPPRWLRTAVWPLAVMLAAAVIQTGSRGGLLCTVVGIAVFSLRGHTVLARVRSITLAVLAMGALTAGVWRSDVMRHRLEESAEEGRLAGREAIYPATLGMIAERPWIGWGPIENQFEIARRIRERELPRRDAHNLLLELFSATGAVGAIPFLVGLALVIRHALRARRGPAGVLPLALLASVLTGTLSGTWIVSKVLWLSFAVAIAADRIASVPRARLAGAT